MQPTDLGHRQRQDAVKFRAALRSLGRHKAADRQTITHCDDGPQRKAFSGGFVVAAAAAKEGRGEVFIASSSSDSNSLRSRQFAPAKRGGTATGRRRRRRNKKERGKSPRVLPFFRPSVVGDLAHFTHQLLHPTEFQVRRRRGRQLLPTAPVISLCTSSFRPRQKHKGRTRRAAS